MEFIDLKSQYQALQPAIRSRINTVLERGTFIMGPEIHELEEKLQDFTGARYCVTCSSGTDALLLALMAHVVGPGDAVFTTPFSFISSAEVISRLGATPIFVDIDAQTFNLNPELLDMAITALKPGLRPKGIIAVNLFGLPAEYAAINAIAKAHTLFVLEDAAQSFGAEYHGKMSGNLADISATSFFPSKPLGGYGDSGAVFTNDETLATKIRSFRIHGQGSNKLEHAHLGINGRMDTLQAAILLAKLEAFQSEMKRRQTLAENYQTLLKDIVIIPQLPDGVKSAWAHYSVLSDRREAIQLRLKQHEIPTAIYYATPLHLQPAFAYLGYKPGSMPQAESISRRIFSLPLHAYLEEGQQAKIAYCINQG